MAREPTDGAGGGSLDCAEGGRVHGAAGAGTSFASGRNAGPQGDITYPLLPTDRPPPPARRGLRLVLRAALPVHLPVIILMSFSPEGLC